MNQDMQWFLAGFVTFGVLYGYFALDGHQSYKITRYSDNSLLQEATDFVVGNSTEELIRTNKVGLPKRFIEELISRPLVIDRSGRSDRSACNVRERYMSEFYEISRGLVEQTIPTGPMSWVTKRLTLRSLGKKLNDGR